MKCNFGYKFQGWSDLHCDGKTKLIIRCLQLQTNRVQRVPTMSSMPIPSNATRSTCANKKVSGWYHNVNTYGCSISFDLGFVPAQVQTFTRFPSLQALPKIYDGSLCLELMDKHAKSQYRRPNKCWQTMYGFYSGQIITAKTSKIENNEKPSLRIACSRLSRQCSSQTKKIVQQDLEN